MLTATHAGALLLGLAAGHALLTPPRPQPPTLAQLAGRCAAAGLHVSTGTHQTEIGLGLYLSDHHLGAEELAALRGSGLDAGAWRGIVYVTRSHAAHGPAGAPAEQRSGPFVLSGDAELVKRIAAFCW